jgi:hypothetical protein
LIPKKFAEKKKVPRRANRHENRGYTHVLGTSGAKGNLRTRTGFAPKELGFTQ